MKNLLGVLLAFILVIGCTKDDKTNETSSANIPSITIGNQIWTTKNLDVATYSDGTVIPEVKDPNAWANLTKGAWCYYNNEAANGPTYGKLYNWYAVTGIWNEASKTDASQRKKLAPTGYHIPSDLEWNTLITYLGGESVAGGKMKAASIWNSPNTEATNTSGFTGLAGGALYGNGTFNYAGNSGYWWSSSEYYAAFAWDRTLACDTGNAYRLYYLKTTGFSVRCIRD